MQPTSPETPHNQEPEFKPALDAADLLSVTPEPEQATSPSTIESSREKYMYATEYLHQERLKNNLLNAEGKLDIAKKFDTSTYEILNLDYYRLAVHEQQGIPMPERYKTGEEIREFYIMQTQQLIEQIIEDEPEVIFFLDKSARPVSMMLREMWPLFVDDPNKKLPEQKFINIDANAILGKSSDDDQRPTEEEVAKFHPTPAQIESIRNIYMVPIASKEQDGNDIEPHPDNLRPVPSHPDQYHKALIVDEIRVTGSTARIADMLMREAFPNLSIQHASWMDAGIRSVGRRGYENKVSTQLPPWYNKWFPEGRGIGDPEPGDFLGQKPASREPLSEALRTDIRLLAKDIREGKQSVRPFEGCFQKDPVTGEEDFTKPKYKIAKIAPDGSRTITPPYRTAA